MINSPFIEEIHSCRGSMKKLRKKIYKYNINKYVKPNRHESTIKDALNVLGKRNIPHFLIDELEKYSDFTFSALSGFSLEQVKPLSQISNLTRMQETQIQNIYHKNKQTIKKRRTVCRVLKLHRRTTQSTQTPSNIYSSASIEEDFDQEFQNQSSEQNDDSVINSQSSQLFQPIANSNSFDQQFNNSDAMFQSTMLDFGNEIDLDSQQFLFKC